MPLQDYQLNLVKNELRNPMYLGKTLEEAYSLLHDPVVTEVRKEIPKRLSVSDALSVLSEETCVKLASNPNITDLRDKIISQDVAGVMLWVSIFLKAKIITQQEVAQLSQVLNGKEEVVTQVVSNPRIGTAFLKVPSMPNLIEMEDFTIAYNAVYGG